MIKEYYIIVKNSKGEYGFEPRVGHIVTDKNGNKYGILKEDGIYLIYELTTGMRADHCKYPAHKLSEIQWAIDAVADFITSQIERKDCPFYDQCREIIKAGYKAMEERDREFANEK